MNKKEVLEEARRLQLEEVQVPGRIILPPLESYYAVAIFNLLPEEEKQNG